MNNFEEADRNLPMYNDRSTSVHGKVASKDTVKNINQAFSSATQRPINSNNTFAVLYGIKPPINMNSLRTVLRGGLN